MAVTAPETTRQTRSKTGNSKPRVVETSAAAAPKKAAGAIKKKAASAAPKKAAPKKETKPKVKKTVSGKVTKAKKAVNGAKKVEKKEEKA